MHLRFEFRNTIWLVAAFLAGMTAIAQAAKADKLPDMPEVTGATFNSEKTDVLIYVDVKHAQARDTNTGNSNQPVKTFARGIELAKMHLKEGRSVKVLLGAGEYPVTQTLRIIGKELGDQGKEALLIIEGAGPEKTIVHGYEDWSKRFKLIKTDDKNRAFLDGYLYEAELDEPWGMGPQPWWSRFGVFIGPAGSMPGMIRQGSIVPGREGPLLPMPLDEYEWEDPDGSVRFSHDGNPEDDTPGKWKYIRSYESEILLHGSFGLHEHGEGKPKLYIRTHEPISQRDPIYVATVKRLLQINKKNNIIIRGINFTGTGHYPVAGVGVMIQSDNLLVDNCHFNWHSSRGLSVGNWASNITLRNCQFSYNGWRGLGAGRPDNLLIEDCEAIGNNWRGHLGDQHGCDAAGIKIMGPDTKRGVLVRRLTSAFNYAHGLWFDHCDKEYGPVRIEDSYIGNNLYGFQLYIEKQAGPILINRVLIDNVHAQAGIYAVAKDVTITNSVITTGPRDGACILIGERGNSAVRRSSNWKIEDSALVAEGRNARLISGLWGRQEMWADFYKTSMFEFDAIVKESDKPFAKPDGNYMSAEDWLKLEDVNAKIRPVHDARYRRAGRIYLTRNMANSDEVIQRIGWGLPRTVTANLWNSSLILAKLQFNKIDHFTFKMVLPKAGQFKPIDIKPYISNRLSDVVDWTPSTYRYRQFKLHRSIDGSRWDKVVIKGIPCSIHLEDESEPRYPSVIAMRSSRRAEIDGKKLPAKVTIPLDKKADALLILHSAEDYKNTPGKFGTYRLIFADGSTHETPIIAYGQRWPMEDHITREQATIANKATRWTPLRNENVRPVRIARDEGTAWEWLHLLRIKNPHTDKTIKAIEIETDPTKPQSLTIYAMTVQLPEEE